MSEFISNHWLTLLLALVAFIVWTLGNVLKKKPLVYIGIVLCVLAILSYGTMFNFLREL